MSTAPIRGLLREPHPSIPSGFLSERWIAGFVEAKRRLRHLNDAGIFVTKRRGWTVDPNGKRFRHVDYTYTDPHGKAPLLEQAMVPSSRMHQPVADEEAA